MTFLIDGYNLMHALGYASKSMSAKRFERRRTEFLDWLAKSSAERAAVVRIVFDAQLAVSPSAEQDHKGVRVCFAYRQTADDLIESLIAKEPQPANLTVVSNDHRLQAAARHRGCVSFTCEQFTDWLIDRSPEPKTAEAPVPEKPEGLESAKEAEDLLKAFTVAKRRR